MSGNGLYSRWKGDELEQRLPTRFLKNRIVLNRTSDAECIRLVYGIMRNERCLVQGGVPTDIADDCGR